MRRWSFLIGLLAFAAAPTALLADNVVLDCKGWMPIYDADWKASHLDDGKAKDRTSIGINRDRREIVVSIPGLGRTAVPLVEKQKWYQGRKAVEIRLFGKTIDDIAVAIDRVSGRSTVWYEFANVGPTDDAGRMAFVGNCQPARR